MAGSEQRSTALFVFLLLITMVALGYTGVVIHKQGWGFLQEALINLGSLTWDGQFTLDFVAYLLLSGCWVAWRHRWSWPGIGMALLCVLLGIIVFAPYVMYWWYRQEGRVEALLGKVPERSAP